jgi:hypothetical protein
MTELRIVSHPDVRAHLARLRTKELNFRPQLEGPFTPENGWRIDNYQQLLPWEPPGPPVAGGSWEVATLLSESYAFADPTLVRAFYDPREPLEGRTLLLEVHFWGLRIYAGVRAGGVSDGIREHEGRPARVSAWNYRTLDNHFEAGQIDYEVWKWLDSGEIMFRVVAFSRPAPIDQPVIRLGFWLFGRRTQIRFARRACVRMEELTRAALESEGEVEPPRFSAIDLAVRSESGRKETLVERLLRKVKNHLPSAGR